MSKRWIVPLAGMLIAASTTFGQSPIPTRYPANFQTAAEGAGGDHFGGPILTRVSADVPEEIPIPKAAPAKTAGAPAAKTPDAPATNILEAPAAKTSDAPPLPSGVRSVFRPLEAPAAKTSDAPVTNILEAPAARSPGAQTNWLEPDATLQPPQSPISNMGGSTYRVVSAEADYMLWFPKSNLANVATSTSNQSGFEKDQPLKHSAAIIGGRFSLGYWSIQDDPSIKDGIRTWGVEERSFFVGSSSADANFNNSPSLYRPFFNLNNRTETGFLIAAPGVATGIFNVHGEASYWGTEANFWKNVYTNSPGTTFAVNVMGGLRYLNANTSLGFASNSVFDRAPADPTYASLAGNRLQVADTFSTHNNFLGAQVGVGINWWVESFFNIEASVRFAIGSTSQDLNVNGAQVRTFANGTSQAYRGGLLALPSNIGGFHIDKFTQVPGMDVKFNFPICSYFTLSTGFSAVFWNRVLRASDQTDRTIDVSQLPNFPPGAGSTSTGFGRPSVPFTESNLTVIGISIGAELRW